MFLKIKEVAKRYNIAISTVRTAVKLGMFPKPLQIAGAMRWSLEALQDYEQTGNGRINAYDAQIDSMTEAEFAGYGKNTRRENEEWKLTRKILVSAQ